MLLSLCTECLNDKLTNPNFKSCLWFANQTIKSEILDVFGLQAFTEFKRYILCLLTAGALFDTH
jgi:hypothetical protein